MQPGFDNARALWEQERAAERSYPTTIPPCPSWCELPPSHQYDGYWPNSIQGVEHTRFHQRSAGAVNLSECEHNKISGGVERHGVTISFEEQCVEDVSAEQARRLAANLLAAADLLDRITTESAAQARVCPRTAPHVPHDWPSMVAGEAWRCPGVTL